MQAQAARPHTDLPGIGLPADRRANYAAREAFSDLKRTYQHVLQGTTGSDWLRQEVERAEDPMDLWELRASAFAMLDGVDADKRSRRQLLHRGLDRLFPDSASNSAHAPL